MILKLLESYDYILSIAFFIYFITRTEKNIYINGLCLVLMFDMLFSVQNYVFNLSILSFAGLAQIFLVIYVAYIKLISNVKTQEINPKNVCLVFYRPKTFKQYLLSMFGLNVSSSGVIIGNKLYQMRYEAKTLQEREYTKNYINKKYLVIDTGFKIKNLKGKWREDLISQKARQPKTLWIRLNCLRSLGVVLNQIPNFHYKGEVLPSIYLLKVKLKGIL